MRVVIGVSAVHRIVQKLKELRRSREFWNTISHRCPGTAHVLPMAWRRRGNGRARETLRTGNPPQPKKFLDVGRLSGGRVGDHGRQVSDIKAPGKSGCAGSAGWNIALARERSQILEH